MKSVRIVFACMVIITLALSGSVFAQDSTTFDVIITKVRLAARYLQENGEAGLYAFNDPNGAWAWADTYIFVYDCDRMICVAHPVTKWIGADISPKHFGPVEAYQANLWMIQRMDALLERVGMERIDELMRREGHTPELYDLLSSHLA